MYNNINKYNKQLDITFVNMSINRLNNIIINICNKHNDSLNKLKDSNIDFLTPPPGSYYEMLNDRVPNVSEQINVLQKNAILVDGDHDDAIGPARREQPGQCGHQFPVHEEIGGNLRRARHVAGEAGEGIQDPRPAPVGDTADVHHEVVRLPRTEVAVHLPVRPLLLEFSERHQIGRAHV